MNSPLQPRMVILQVRAELGLWGDPLAYTQTPHDKCSVPGPHPQGSSESPFSGQGVGEQGGPVVDKRQPPGPPTPTPGP